jgi:hypothetical protein
VVGVGLEAVGQQTDVVRAVLCGSHLVRKLLLFKEQVQDLQRCLYCLRSAPIPG